MKGNAFIEQAPARVRVCHLIPCLRQGGAESQVLLSLQAADSDSFEVHLCVMKDGDRQLEDRALGSVESVFHLDFRWRRALGSARRLKSFLQEQQIEILHCHLPLADAFGRIVGLVSGVDVLVTTEHGKHLWKRWPHRLLDRWLNHHTAVRICVSHDIAQIRREREGLSVQKSPVIPNAVDLVSLQARGAVRSKVLAEWGWEHDTELVLAVGRLVVAKNYPLLIHAIGHLHRTRPKVRCLVAGGGPVRAELESAVAEANLEGVLVLAGPRTDVPDLLRAANVYALSSIREGLPVAMLEAMACALPVVATPAGGVTEVLHDGTNGLVVEHDQPEAFARALESILEAPERARLMGARAAQDIAEGYDIRSTVLRTEELYLQALKASQEGRDLSATNLPECGQGDGS